MNATLDPKQRLDSLYGRVHGMIYANDNHFSFKTPPPYSHQQILEADDTYKAAFFEVYPSLEDFIGESFQPAQNVATEWSLEYKDRARTVDEYQGFRPHAYFAEIIQFIKKDAQTALMVVHTWAERCSLKGRHSYENLQTADISRVAAAFGMAVEADNQTTTKTGLSRLVPSFISMLGVGEPQELELGLGEETNFTGTVEDVRMHRWCVQAYGSSHSFLHVDMVADNGDRATFVVSHDRLRQGSLDKSPYNATKLRVGDRISVDLERSHRAEIYDSVRELRGYPEAKFMHMQVPAEILNPENGRHIEAEMIEVGRVVLRGDWPHRDVTVRDHEGNLGTITIAEVTDHAECPVPVKVGQRFMGVIDGNGRVTAMTPLTEQVKLEM